MKVESPLLQARIIEIHQVFPKKKSDPFLTEYIETRIIEKFESYKKFKFSSGCFLKYFLKNNLLYPNINYLCFGKSLSSSLTYFFWKSFNSAVISEGLQQTTVGIERQKEF